MAEPKKRCGAFCAQDQRGRDALCRAPWFEEGEGGKAEEKAAMLEEMAARFYADLRKRMEHFFNTPDRRATAV